MDRKRNPKVSIGIPVYNAEKFLREGLDSILAQTYNDFEIIIADNDSTDQTRKICLEYAQKDPRVKYHRNEKNLGAAPNHNLVFRLAKGEYFKWAGYDDVISSDFLEKCVEILDKNPDVVLCMPRSCLIDENGKYIGDYHYKADGYLSAPEERFRSFLLYNESGNYVYGLMRLNCVAQTALQGSYPSADLVFLAELALYGKYFILPEKLFFRRMHPEQSTKGALSVERSRMLWFDTALKGKIVLPKLRFLSGSLRAVHTAPLNMKQRIICYIQIIRWIFLSHNIRALGKDFLIAVQKLFTISYSKLKGIFSIAR